MARPPTAASLWEALLVVSSDTQWSGSVTATSTAGYASVKPCAWAPSTCQSAALTRTPSKPPSSGVTSCTSAVTLHTPWIVGCVNLGKAFAPMIPARDVNDNKASMTSSTLKYSSYMKRYVTWLPAAQLGH